MDKRRIERLAIRAVPVVILATFLIQEWNQQSMKVWILTDVLVITYGLGAFSEGIFTKRIEAINHRAVELGWDPPLGRSWLFMGLSIGALIAGLLGQAFSEVATMSQLETSMLVIEETVIAVGVLLFVFQARYGGVWRRRHRADFFLDG